MVIFAVAVVRYEPEKWVFRYLDGFVYAQVRLLLTVILSLQLLVAELGELAPEFLTL